MSISTKNSDILMIEKKETTPLQRSKSMIVKANITTKKQVK